MPFDERDVPTGAGEHLLSLLLAFRAAPNRENWEALSVATNAAAGGDQLAESFNILVSALDAADPSAAAVAEARREAQRALTGVKPPHLVPVGEAPDGQPAPVLWADRDNRLDPVLSEGEICLLSAAGGTGRSYLTLALAASASAAYRDGAAYGDACGLRVRPGPVVLISYEDTDQRIKHRLRTMGKLNDSEHVYILKDPDPLYSVDTRSRGRAEESPGWDLLWESIREMNPSLVVIDPAGSALEGAAQGESQPVRAFVRAVERESRSGGWGTLVVAHDNKTHRNAVSTGGDLNSGAVSGSAAWIDAARAILFLRTISNKRRLLTALKANYGTRGWGAQLSEVFSPPNDTFGGFQLDGPVLDEDEVETLLLRLSNEYRPRKSSSSRSSNGRQEENIYEDAV